MRLVGTLDNPLSRVVGAKTAKALAALGLETEADLLRHYPRRYGDPSRLTDFTDLPPGDHVTVIARPLRTSLRGTRNPRTAMLDVTITDGHGELLVRLFGGRGFLASRERLLQSDRVALFTGQVDVFGGRTMLKNPDFEFLDSEDDHDGEAVERRSWPVPIYAASSAMPTWRIKGAVQTVLQPLTEADLPDPIPAKLLERSELPSLHEALWLVHEPHEDADWKRGQRRLRYEEAFVLQAVLAQRRAELREIAAVARPPRDGGIRTDFEATLPFTLTAGQLEVGATLAEELARQFPMQRLLQGEVGSGKTIVALRAMLQVVDAGGQAALLAPTEVLAAQHARSISAMLGPLAEAGMLGGASNSTRVALLTGSMPAAARKAALLAAASGEAGIVIGTHALLSEGVQFADLGLVVVDEQHRFGVEQRDALRAKAKVTPHLLVMTATPIPRTVAMTVFGDLETSTLREVPAGRAGVTTYVIPPDQGKMRTRTWQLAREQVDAGGRVYVVCPRITAADDATEPGTDLPAVSVLPAPADPGAGAARPSSTSAGAAPRGSDSADTPLTPPTALPLPSPSPSPRAGAVDEAAGGGPGSNGRVLAAVDQMAEALGQAPALAGVPIGQLHGRMTPEEKETVMADFASGKVPVLVTTTVVEVGVDVPEATMMVILDADRFGISQLHQLRGRIGRGSRPGTCLAWSNAPKHSPAMTRLEAFAATTDGFELARVDLEQRREGDVLGAAQSGRGSSLRLLRVLKDGKVIEQARADAREIVDADPTLAGHPALARAIADQVDEERAEFLDRA